jgi:hypothetical protein
MIREGTIVDATLIAAPPSTENKDGLNMVIAVDTHPDVTQSTAQKRDVQLPDGLLHRAACSDCLYSGAA